MTALPAPGLTTRRRCCPKAGWNPLFPELLTLPLCPLLKVSHPGSTSFLKTRFCGSDYGAFTGLGSFPTPRPEIGVREAGQCDLPARGTSLLEGPGRHQLASRKVGLGNGESKRLPARGLAFLGFLERRLRRSWAALHRRAAPEDLSRLVLSSTRHRSSVPPVVMRSRASRLCPRDVLETCPRL